MNPNGRGSAVTRRIVTGTIAVALLAAASSGCGQQGPSEWTGLVVWVPYVEGDANGHTDLIARACQQDCREAPIYTSTNGGGPGAASVEFADWASSVAEDVRVSVHAKDGHVLIPERFIQVTPAQDPQIPGRSVISASVIDQSSGLSEGRLSMLDAPSASL